MLDYAAAENNPNDKATQTIIKIMHAQKLLIIVDTVTHIPVQCALTAMSLILLMSCTMSTWNSGLL